MRLTELILIVAVVISLLGGVMSGVRRSVKLSEKAIDAERKAMCMKFIPESFRATCEGNGFLSFVDWQISCRAMFDLEYIGYGNAVDFMADVKPELVYGKWKGPYGDGEVYAKKNNF